MAKTKSIPVYKIDRDVPVPEDAKQPSTREIVPIDKLEVGESIEFPRHLQSLVAPIASRLKREGKSFVIKKVDEDNARIWRVE